MISLITVTQGNPVALRRTMDNLFASFEGALNEAVIGDVSVFDGDFASGFDDAKFVKLPFNSLFKDGFSSVLNHLAAQANNDLCLYLNVGEIIEKNLKRSLVRNEFNCYSFNHATDPHIWVRMWDRRELSWSGRIHEEIVGPRRQCPEILFQMADTDKDMADEFRAGVYNDIKEMVYFQQYVHLAEHPEDKGATDQGWLNYSQAEYEDLKRRLSNKGERYRAFLDGDLAAYLQAAEKDKPEKDWSKP